MEDIRNKRCAEYGWLKASGTRAADQNYYGLAIFKLRVWANGCEFCAVMLCVDGDSKLILSYYYYNFTFNHLVLILSQIFSGFGDPLLLFILSVLKIYFQF